jgi:hypothetical protein
MRNARRQVRPVFLVLAFSCSLVCLGCNDGADANAESDGGPSSDLCSGWAEPGVAFAPNFDGFHSWKTASATAPGGASDGIHGLGPLTVYWNASPPHGATQFPQCTIIVKESQQPDAGERTTFAMVKRDDGFNSGGANGWEWFSLQDNADGSGASILWGDVAPPAGEPYASTAAGDCNSCHTQSLPAKNDSVWDTALQLSNF